MIRKFNIEFSKKNPFKLNPKNIWSEQLSWDWHFEQHAWNVKEETIKNFTDTILIGVENRAIADYVFTGCTIEVPHTVAKVDSLLIQFYQGLYGRMIKTSKVIQDLTVQGSYVEAKALLRSNFEKAVHIEYFTKNIHELSEFLKARTSKNRNILKKYSMRNLVQNIQKNYKDYEHLCKFVHSYFHEEDISFFEIEGEGWLQIQPYNSFDNNECVWINVNNNNILMEALIVMFEYMMGTLSEEVRVKKFQKAIDEMNKVAFIEMGSKEVETKS